MEWQWNGVRVGWGGVWVGLGWGGLKYLEGILAALPALLVIAAIAPPPLLKLVQIVIQIFSSCWSFLRTTFKKEKKERR